MKRQIRVAIVAGGTVSKVFIKEITTTDYVIGVDRGAYWLVQNGIVPHVAIGDFDSVSALELEVIEQRVKRIEKHPAQKDCTDMELAALHALSRRPKEVVIYGAIGSRLDHTVANVHLLERLGDIGVIRDANNEMRVVSGRWAVQKNERYRYVSVLPVTETIDVTLTGFLYDVTRVRIRRGQTLGISNEIRGDKATVEVHHGKALVVSSRD